jgi:ribosomal protein L1
MSKIPANRLKSCITKILTTRKQRKFVETIDLHICLKDYDPYLDKRFQGSVSLPNIPKRKLKVNLN